MTTPTGRLAYGQAGVYDALDDRAVISAVTGYRTGLAGLVQVRAGAGLAIVVTGGWLGVADCGDRTSAVVGSPTDATVNAAPGPPTGTREDVLWIDVDPDEGVWSMVIIPASAAAGRPGLPLASITVPANATLASQMTIRPADAVLERRLVAFDQRGDTRSFTAFNFGAATTVVAASALTEQGHAYRARFATNSMMAVSGSLNGRIGVGHAPDGSPESATQLGRGAYVAWPRLNQPVTAEAVWVFRHEGATVMRAYRGRVWIEGSGTYRPNAGEFAGNANALQLTVEDLGT